MGGQIEVTSVPGQGSRFLVRMLLFAALPTPRDESVHRNIVGYVGRPISVLLADDDPAHLDVVRQILAPLGFAVFTASNGTEAITLARECVPQLALLDISMPGLDGWRTAEQLRLERPDLRIMMVSANAHDGQAVDREALLHDAFLMKPFDLGRLLAQLQALCGLEWIYEAPGHAKSDTAGPDGLPKDAAWHIAELIHLGEIGYARGIQAKLDEMESEDRAYGALVEQARTLARDFRFQDYVDFLKRQAP